MATVGLAVLIWRVNRPISVFLGMAFFSMLYPFYTQRSYRTFQAIFMGGLWFYIVATVFDRQSVRYLLDALCIIALINVAWLILQYFDIDPLLRAIDGSPDDPEVGLMGNRNHTATLLVLCFPAFMRRKWAWFLPVMIIGLVMSKTSGGIVALAFGLMVWGIVMRLEKLVLPWVVVGLILFFVFVDLPSVSSRFGAWVKGLDLFTQHWLFGAGIGHWKTVFKAIKMPSGLWFTTAHNEYIQTLFEMGIGFVVVLVWFFVGLISKLKNVETLTIMALAIAVVVCGVNFAMHVPTTAGLILTWLGIAEAEQKIA